MKLLQFLNVNYNGETDPSNLWETTKSYLKGMMIFYCAARKKKIMKEPTLNEFSCGDSFIDWVKLLYTSPQAAVSVNGLSSQVFPIERGTKQGCPPSLLL